MSELTTVARPYAKAAFDYAVEQKALEAWGDMLQFAAAVAEDESVTALLGSNLVPEQLGELFVQICADKVDDHGKNLLKVMAENGRLAALPQVAEQFAALRTEYEQVMHVEVSSASELTKAQESALVTKLTDRFGRKVELACTVDETLIGGFVAQAGDLVIDESVRGQLVRLNDALKS